MDKLIKVEEMPAGKPEHHMIRLRLLKTDIPDFPIGLPTSITTSIDSGSLQIRFDGSDQGIHLPGKDILEVRLFEESHGCYLGATIRYRDPYEVVPAFNILVGSTEMYWIKAFGKMVAEKLGVSVCDASEENIPF